jgi:ribosomal protein S12 methylthiotransferase
MRIFIQSLGCPKNLVDSEMICGFLWEGNYTLTNDLENCDIALINTCSFIQPAVEESIDAILQAALLKQEGKIKFIIVAGCLSQRYKQEDLVQSFPEVDAFMGIDEIARVSEIIENIQNIETEKNIFRVNYKPNFLGNEKTPRLLMTPRHYAYLKIAEGCNNACTYCLIPYIKGSYRSKSISSVFKEAQYLVNSYPLKEIILIAEDTTNYGIDLYGKPSLAKLLQELTQLKWSGENKIRILYTHPAHYDDELIDCLAENSIFCPYLDLPLQHISDAILAKMNRQVNQNDIKSLIKKLRTKIPDLTLRTTFMVGFPGETEDNFQELCDFVQEYQFEKVGVFRYYNETGCPAHKLSDQVPKKVKEKRWNELMKIQQKISLTHQKKKIGKKMKVLIDEASEKEENILLGRSYAEAPDIDGNIAVSKGSNKDIGTWINVKINEAYPYQLKGEKIGK